MTNLEYIFQQIINALSIGGLYALIAVGLSIVFSILRLTNFAHGDMMMVGAFGTILANQAGFPFAVAVFCGILVSCLVGVLIERIAYRPVRGASDVTTLLTSVALTYILENLGILLFTSTPRNFEIPPSLDGMIATPFASLSLNYITVMTLVTTLLALAFLGWFIKYTKTGLRMRAVAEDLTAAYLMGIDVNRVIVIAFVLASGFAGLAGVLWAAQAGVVEPLMGFTPLLKAFVAAIIGGFGSIAGALLGGFALGALEVLIQGLPADWGVSPYRDALVFILLIFFLLFRPNGLLGVRNEVKL